MPKRILLLSPVGEKGGAETVLLDIARGLDRTRFEPLAACLRPGPLVEELRALDIPVFTFRAHKARELPQVAAAVGNLARLIRRENVDLVHGNGGTTLFYGGLAGRFGGRRPCVWHVYDPLRGGGVFERAFVAAQRRIAPAWTIFGTPAVCENYLAAYPNIRRHCTILPGIAAEEMLTGANPERARKSLGIPPEALLVSMFARLQRNKGHLVLLKAVQQVLLDHPNAYFVVCGGSLFGLEPQYPQQLNEEIRQRGLCGRVLLTGYVSDMEKKDILAASNVVVHPALSEPFGIAILEGMAAGKPVVSTDCVGPQTLIQPGETGLLVARGDSQALAQALGMTLANPADAMRMGQAGRRLVERQYTVQAMVRQVEDIYSQVLGQAAS